MTLLALIPLSVAVITNLGSSSSKAPYSSSLEPVDGVIGQYYTNSYWIDNGGTNYTSHYETNLIGNQLALDCVYINDGYCQGKSYQTNRFDVGASYLPYQLYLPTNAVELYQSHYSNLREVDDIDYVGNSGDERYAWHFQEEFLSNIEQEQSIDDLLIFMVEDQVYNCNSTIFQNIQFKSSITFIYGNSTHSINDLGFDISNKFEYDDYALVTNSYSLVCSVGFVINFDFSSFESLGINELNRGDWDNTTFILSIHDITSDNNEYGIADSELPFAGGRKFFFSSEVKQVNPQEIGFLIKGGTVLLSLMLITLGVASTPYWDPFKNIFDGRL